MREVGRAVCVWGVGGGAVGRGEGGKPRTVRLDLEGLVGIGQVDE